MSKYPFKLGVITDEVSQDIFEAAEFAKKHGLEIGQFHAPFPSYNPGNELTMKMMIWI